MKSPYLCYMTISTCIYHVSILKLKFAQLFAQFSLLLTSRKFSVKFHYPDDGNIASKTKESSLYDLLMIFNQKILLVCQIAIID